MTNRQSASLFGTSHFICIHSLYGFNRALLAEDGHRVYLPVGSSEKILGSALLEALDKSHAVDPGSDFFEGVRILAAYKYWLREAMANYKIRSQRQMFEHLAYCRINRENGTIWLESHHHLGGDRVEDLDDNRVLEIPATTDPLVVGAAVRLAMNRCT